MNWLFLSLASLVSGTLFPVTLLPSWLQVLSCLIPLTHALNALRGSLLLGQSAYALRYSFLALLVFQLVLFPLAAILSYQVLRYARQHGTLGSY